MLPNPGWTLRYNAETPKALRGVFIGERRPCDCAVVCGDLVALAERTPKKPVTIE